METYKTQHVFSIQNSKTRKFYLFGNTQYEILRILSVQAAHHILKEGIDYVFKEGWLILLPHCPSLNIGDAVQVITEEKDPKMIFKKLGT